MMEVMVKIHEEFDNLKNGRKPGVLRGDIMFMKSHGFKGRGAWITKRLK